MKASRGGGGGERERRKKEEGRRKEEAEAVIIIGTKTRSKGRDYSRLSSYLTAREGSLLS